MQPIVSFDSSFAAPGLSSRALFVAAWRSFDRAAHLRVLKVYASMAGAQFVLALLGMTLMAAEVVVIGGERLAIFYSGVRAELELMAIERQGGAISG
jgi:type IV secretory pathway TrbL component